MVHIEGSSLVVLPHHSGGGTRRYLHTVIGYGSSFVQHFHLEHKIMTHNENLKCCLCQQWLVMIAKCSHWLSFETNITQIFTENIYQIWLGIQLRFQSELLEQPTVVCVIQQSCWSEYGKIWEPSLCSKKQYLTYRYNTTTSSYPDINSLSLDSNKTSEYILV